MVIFVYGAEHYDETLFPWHYNAINELFEELFARIPKLSDEEKWEIVGEFYHLEMIEPMKKLRTLLFSTESISSDSSEVSNGRLNKSK